LLLLLKFVKKTKHLIRQSREKNAHGE